jgi:hypothetical protein
MENHAAVFGRVDGQFTGTTDEIIQWAAAKWGLPDNLIRAEAVVESYWYQDNRNSSGDPISGEGYGDFGSCGELSYGVVTRVGTLGSAAHTTPATCGVALGDGMQALGIRQAQSNTSTGSSLLRRASPG